MGSVTSRQRAAIDYEHRFAEHEHEEFRSVSKSRKSILGGRVISRISLILPDVQQCRHWRRAEVSSHHLRDQSTIALR
jgi:hypothetical protein